MEDNPDCRGKKEWFNLNIYFCGFKKYWIGFMSFSAKFDINEKLVNDKAKIVLFKTMLKMQRIAKRLVPVDTARLRRSIILTPTVVGSTIFKLSTNVEYAADVEFGTRPHVIKPSSKKALSFKMKGKNIVVKKVQHPGTRPQPYFRPAIFQAKHKDVKIIFKDTFKK